MRTAILVTLLAFFLVITTQQQLRYLDGQDSSKTVEQLIDKFEELQQDVYKNVFRHFITQALESWKTAGKTKKQIRKEVHKLLTDANEPLFQNLTEFMQKKLFEKLEMGQLTASLIQQIKAHPENFYLTFDIYDLLFD